MIYNPEKNHKMDWKNIEVLHYENDWKKRTIAEMYYINKQGPSSMNKITDLNDFPPCYDSTIGTFHPSTQFVMGSRSLS